MTKFTLYWILWCTRRVHNCVVCYLGQTNYALIGIDVACYWAKSKKQNVCYFYIQFCIGIYFSNKGYSKVSSLQCYNKTIEWWYCEYLHNSTRQYWIYWNEYCVDKQYCVLVENKSKNEWKIMICFPWLIWGFTFFRILNICHWYALVIYIKLFIGIWNVFVYFCLL